MLLSGNPESADQLEGPWSHWLWRAGARRNVSLAASQKWTNTFPLWQAAAHYQETRRNLHIQGSHTGQSGYSECRREKESIRLHVHSEGKAVSLCILQCCNLMLVEVIPKEPLSFSVFHYKNPKLQHTVQVQQTHNRSPAHICKYSLPYTRVQLESVCWCHATKTNAWIIEYHVKKYRLNRLCSHSQAKSQQDKRMWILHLKRLILENHPAKIPAKVGAPPDGSFTEMDWDGHSLLPTPFLHLHLHYIFLSIC